MNALKLTNDELDVVKSALNSMKKNIEMVLNEPMFFNRVESDKETLQTALRLAENVVEKIDLCRERNVLNNLAKEKKD